MKRTYRRWVAEGARGCFLTPGVAVNATRLIDPLDRRGGYFVRRDTGDATQRALRARLLDTDKQDGERSDTSPARQNGRHNARQNTRHVVPEESSESGESSESSESSESGESSHVGVAVADWILTHRVERPAEVVQRGWLTWESLGEVVEGVERRARHVQQEMQP